MIVLDFNSFLTRNGYRNKIDLSWEAIGKIFFTYLKFFQRIQRTSLQFRICFPWLVSMKVVLSFWCKEI